MTYFVPGHRPRLAILDPMCGEGYDPRSLETGGLGGTEATVLRVAAALGEDIRISHFQRGRIASQRATSAEFHPLAEIENAPAADAVVVINAWKVAIKLRRSYPDVPIFVWLHVYPGKHNRRMGPALHAADITVICVSRSHADRLRSFLGEGPKPEVTHIHNPISDRLRPDATPRNPNRLLFASSPHKGLKEVYGIFAALRETLPDLLLAVADPGYLRWEVGPAPEGALGLGSLSHAALIRQMRRSLCVFYPQTSFEETFGLVLAEANAVGTPVLAHRGLGANEEVLTSSGQLLDCTDLGAIRDCILGWQQNLPTVTVNPAFRLRAVRQDWLALLKDALRRNNQQIKAETVR